MTMYQGLISYLQANHPGFDLTNLPNYEAFCKSYPGEAATRIDWKFPDLDSSSYDPNDWLQSDLTNFSRLSDTGRLTLVQGGYYKIVNTFTRENIQKMLEGRWKQKKKKEGKEGKEDGKEEKAGQKGGKGKRKGWGGKGKAKGKRGKGKRKRGEEEEEMGEKRPRKKGDRKRGKGSGEEKSEKRGKGKGQKGQGKRKAGTKGKGGNKKRKS